MTDERTTRLLWWPCLVIAPAVLITIELFHPAGFTAQPGMFQFLSRPMPSDAHYKALAYPGPHWWFVLHMIQTPLVGLVSVGLWLLVSPVRDSDGAGAAALAWLSRAATLVFLIYYTALDSIGGTGLGRLLINTQDMAQAGQLTREQVDGIARLLNVGWTDPWVGGVGSFVSLTGSWALFASVLFAVASLFITGKAPWPALALLVAFGWELQTSHASPHGPIAFALLIAAAIWIWWVRRLPPGRGEVASVAAAGR